MKSPGKWRNPHGQLPQHHFISSVWLIPRESHLNANCRRTGRNHVKWAHLHFWGKALWSMGMLASSSSTERECGFHFQLDVGFQSHSWLFLIVWQIHGLELNYQHNNVPAPFCQRLVFLNSSPGSNRDACMLQRSQRHPHVSLSAC